MTEGKTKAELVGLLREAVRIESGFEGLSNWMGYGDSRSERMREILFRIAEDSKGHRAAVEGMIGMMKPTAEDNMIGSLPPELDFAKKSAVDLIGDMPAAEMAAYELYEFIRKATENSDTSSYLSPEDRTHILNRLTRLAHDEKVHYDIASNLSKYWY